MTTPAVDTRSSLQQALAWVIATFAAAGGLIHIEASIDHRDLTVVAIGFAAMALSQLALAGVVLVRPSPTVLSWMGALHAGIALVWIMSRTIGLPFIPGAEQAAQVGVADVVANTFSIAVVGATVIALTLDRSYQAPPLSPATARTIRLVALVGALILTVAALSETHDHAELEVSGPAAGHIHDHSSMGRFGSS
jgi:hypothetical protein